MFKKPKTQFQFYSENEVIDSTKTLSILSALLFIVFVFVDIWAIPSAFNEVVSTRLLVLVALVFTYFSTYHPSFYKYKDYVLSFIFLTTSLGIEYMVYKALPHEHAYSVYFVGLVLIIMTLYSWTYIKFSASLVVTFIVMGGYFYIENYTRAPEFSLTIFELITNLFFVTSAVVIGIVARLMRDKFIRENYLLQEALTHALEKKTEEAKDNEYLANHDPLTGLPNRRYMTELLEASMKEAEEKDKVLVIMFLDLNGFKQVNDIYGHAAGDKVLKVVAKRLELAIRRGDHIARLGGDEYLIGLMMDKDHLGEAENMTEKFAAIIAQPMNIEGIRVRVGSSIGLSAYPIHGNQISVLLDIADKRMYAAKKGRPPISVGSSYQQKDNKVAVFPGKKV
ncbi:hypothetical protein GCM10009133_35980 [Cocleimonas flava]|uniref:Diguanylate cyclase (GGDEF)-like protein n=1 Tax=Cocleimonas flava TaxID=634765 RepID=A0A4R1F592_9GAMM|nr:GGDEF domain-containing protein [Cocleimonas flava]TCJ88560.1 diguanylate cyclase (GGDEF)-like protein [Cocleimonas flava]